MSHALMQALTIDGAPVRQDADGRVSLTDLYQMAEAKGWTDGKRDPRRWKDEAGAELIDVVAQTLNVRTADIIKGTRGKGGSTYAHPNIALAYAKYLSPELHMQVNDVYIRAKSGDIKLAAQISDRASAKDQAWLAKRVLTTITRNEFTSTLCNHGVTGKGYPDATNAIYSTLMGGDKKSICLTKGYPLSTNLRDMMDIEELTRTQLAEIIAIKHINNLKANGNRECTTVCQMAARKVAEIQ